MKSKLKTILILLAVVTCFVLKAGDETRSSRAYANNIVTPGSFIQAADDKFTGSSGWHSGSKLFSNLGVVELGLNEDMHNVNQPFKVCAFFDVAVTDSNLVTTYYLNQQLTINYNPYELTRYKDKAQLVFPNAYKIKVFNMDLRRCALTPSCCNTQCFNNDVYIEASITTTKIYNFNFTTAFSNNSDITDLSNSTNQELVVAWDYKLGAEQYELEYTHVDNYFVTDPSYDFSFDATRIVTSANSYTIPLTYESGFIVYRIRPIGLSPTNQRMEGAWFGAPVSGAVSLASPFSEPISAFNGDKFNWQSTRTFAEHGRTGVGVSYADAMGYVRQSLAHLNTESKSIAQSTLYDYYGRPIINVLPAPVSGKTLAYRNSLNKALVNSNVVIFDHSIFGQCTDSNNICHSSAILLDTSSLGAGKYYSPHNPNKNGYQAFVPNAEGIPYTQVKYKPNALGQVVRQTLPGSLHSLGSNKDIRYFYAQPTQIELDRLFGSEAGRAKYYFKNITIDPNGQTSATYLDNYGKTVATTLMGTPPANVDPLPNVATQVPLTEYLHVQPTNDSDSTNLCYEVNSSFFVSSINTTEGYVYYTTLGSFASTCVANTCYDCVYDVIISIKDDCGNEVFDYDANNATAPGFTASIGKQPPYNPVLCSSSPTGTFIAGTSLNTPVIISFPKAGVYTVYKKICVSDAPVVDYSDDFITNLCDNKQCYFLDSLLSKIDFSSCNLDANMTCASCKASIDKYLASGDSTAILTSNPISSSPGSTFQFTTSVNTPTNITPQQISQSYENCDLFCTPKTECEKYTFALLKDFYPGGQYADTIVNGPNWTYSIFNPNNQLASPVITFQTPTNYMNAANNLDYVQINNVNKPINQLTKAQYVHYYRKSWAKSLIQYHPEYCKLYYYCNILGPSLEYDKAMKGITHYDTACASGFLFPINYNYYSSYKPQGCTSSNNDPIVSVANLSANYNNLVTAFVNQIDTNFNGSSNNSQPNFDIYQYVLLQSVPQASVLNYNDWVGKDSCRQDFDWLTFRKFYLGKKAALYIKLDSIYSANPSAYGCTGGVSPPAGYASDFPNINSTLNSLFPNSSSQMYVALNPPSNVANNASSASSFTSAMSTLSSNIVSTLNSTLSSQCTAACNSYTNNWHMILNSGCSAYGNASQLKKDSIMSGLVGVCIHGCDYNSNLGGASTTSPNNGFTLPNSTAVVTSFQQVLDTYLGNNACNSIILTQPGPYPVSTPTSQLLSSCKCDQLLQVEHDYYVMQANSTLPAGINAPWKLFRKNYGFDLAEYNILKCICKLATGNTWVPGHTWTSAELSAIAQNTMPINPKLTCTSCLKCTDVSNAMDGFFNTLPSSIVYPDVITAITQDSINHVFASAYLNNQFGVHMFQNYIDLYNDCQTFTATASIYTFSNSITDESLDLYRYMNQLVSTKVLTNTNRLPKICTDSKYFLSTLYSGSLPNTPLTYTYFAIQSSNNLTVNIKDGTTTLLSFSLTFPSSYTGNWQSFKYLNNFVAYCPPTIVSGPNYGFQVKAVDNAFSVITLTGSIISQNFPVSNLSSGPTPEPMLCPKKPKKQNNCATTLINSALTQANFLNQQYLDSLRAQFQNKYKIACYHAINETFTRTYNGADEHEYTLYYYDKAGNLQRTVPPAGVAILNISTPLPATPLVFPHHSAALDFDRDSFYVSKYEYSTFNQPLLEKNVDGGTTNYFYDQVGRIIASQNAKQAAASISPLFVYSYTLYDDIGRIKEVGEMNTSSQLSLLGNYMGYDSGANFVSIVAASTKTQVTRTFYDSLPGIISANAVIYLGTSGNKLQNPRNRVICAMYSDDPTLTRKYDHATYYSYDDHGNVNMVINENNMLPNSLSGSATGYNMQFKKIVYDYELISGNMVKATYQPHQQDMLMHKYYYDDDNRLHEVYTSRDSLNWDRDAKYFYYEHGPLARIERADKEVQGMDYFYTIHGWIKGINSGALSTDADAGKDGAFNSTYISNYDSIHAFFAKDAMAFNLNYYNAGVKKDYAAINAAAFNYNTYQNPEISLAGLYTTNSYLTLDNNALGDGASLYNGNISSMVTSFIDKDISNTILDNKPFPLFTAYRYDQLHRITKMKSFRSLNTNAWNTPNTTNYDNSYLMNFTYDANGNILTLFRNGADPALKPGASLAMDNLAYNYKTWANGASVNSNQLYTMNDLTSGSTYTDDIKAPVSPVSAYSSAGANRYNYDAIGNLIEDKGECIDQIIWTVDRKVKQIIRSTTQLTSQNKTLPDVEYEYNAMRQRVTKIVKPRDPSTKALKNGIYWMYTYYVYDASGNVMATYDRSISNNSSVYKETIKLDEQYVYGSSRLAVARPINTLAQWTNTFSSCGDPYVCRTGISSFNPLPVVTTQTYLAERDLGYKEFELTNHLGNVIATVSDRKILLTTCVNEFLINFTVSTGNPILNQSAVSIVNSQLQVNPLAALSDVAFPISVQPATSYELSFDVSSVKLTPNDNLTAYLYGYNSSAGILSSQPVSSVRVSNSGVYKLQYDPPGDGTVYDNVYVDFRLSSPTYTASLYSLHNLILIGIPIDPGQITLPCYLTAQFKGYFPDLLMHNDYYAFGQTMPGRQYVATDYRYGGAGGQEKDDEIFVGAFTAEYWEYDARLGRRWNTDPISYAEQSTYATFNNDPIRFADPYGLKGDDVILTDKKTGEVTRMPDMNGDEILEYKTGTWNEEHTGFIGETTKIEHYSPGNGALANIDNSTRAGSNPYSFHNTNYVPTNYQKAQYAFCDFAQKATAVTLTAPFVMEAFPGASMWALRTTGVGALEELAGMPSPEGFVVNQTEKKIIKEAVKESVQKFSPFEFIATHGITKSKSQYNALKLQIKNAGEVTESIKYVEHHGQKYVVDGHHRLRAAKELGLENVPAEKVSLPYGSYKTTADLQYSHE